MSSVATIADPVLTCDDKQNILAAFGHPIGSLHKDVEPAHGFHPTSGVAHNLCGGRDLAILEDPWGIGHGLPDLGVHAVKNHIHFVVISVWEAISLPPCRRITGGTVVQIEQQCGVASLGSDRV